MKSQLKEAAKFVAESKVKLPEDYNTLLNDTDLKLLFDFVPMDSMIHPIRAKNNKYRKYIMRLGKLNKNSKQVQRQMRPVAIELYKAGDPIYVRMGKSMATVFLMDTETALRAILGDEDQWPQIQQYNTEQMAEFVEKCREEFKTAGFSFRLDILWLSFKLLHLPISDEVRQSVNREMTTRWQAQSAAGGEGSTEAEGKAAEQAPEEQKSGDTMNTTENTAVQPSLFAEEGDELPGEEATLAAQAAVKEEEDAGTEKTEMPQQPPVTEPWYVGKINIIESFYNFTPLGTWNGRDYVPLSDEELLYLLPKSQQYRNINLSYSYPDQRFMEEHFHENDLVFLRFKTDELLDNKDGRGNLRATGCRILCVDAYKNGKLHFGYELGLYPICLEDSLQDPISRDTILRIRDEHLFAGEKIFLGLMSGQVAGPYTVRHSARYGYYLESSVPDDRYLLDVYDAAAFEDVQIVPADDTMASRQEKTVWDLYRLVPGSKKHTIDLMGDETLLLSLGKTSGDGELTPQKIRDFLDRQKNSLFANVPRPIAKQRVARIQTLLQNAEGRQMVNDKVGAFLYTFLTRQKDQEWAKTFTKDFLEDHPDLWKILPGVKNLEDKKQRAEKEIERIEEKLRQKRNQLRNHRGGDADLMETAAPQPAAPAPVMLPEAPHLTDDNRKNVEAMAKWVYKMPSAAMTTAQCLDYLVRSVQKERPLYGRNVILNLFVCLTQGFLTVFSGAPGSGKTSICNIMAKVLGLTQFDKRLRNQNVLETLNRYIPVSVERGWTSKRDFIGYYNPLTKSFEESNQDVFESLQLLDVEEEKGLRQYPFVFLLDEANLSPMEYYWADFMNVCDDPEENHTLNLGSGYSIHVPETLRFVATINNDHTTETLSPRLIDRAWIISLPENEYVPRMGRGLSDTDVQMISWSQLQNVFGVDPRESCLFARTEQGIYDSIKSRLLEQNIRLSTRIDIAIHEYWKAASRVMEKENEIKPGIIALDYAVAQKILPKLSGNGTEYETFLQNLRDDCARNNLRQSAALLDRMIAWGSRRMKFFQFFQ